MSMKILLTTFLALAVLILLGLAFTALYPAPKPGQVKRCINNLRQLDGSKQQWAVEHHKATNAVPAWEDLRDYLSPAMNESICPQDGLYTLGPVDARPTCSLGGPQHSLP